MQETKLTSAGHALADTAWLDHDFEAWLRKFSPGGLWTNRHMTRQCGFARARLLCKAKPLDISRSFALDG